MMKSFDNASNLSYDQNAIMFVCNKAPVSAGKAGTRLMTHILTQTAKILCGNSGENDAKQYFEPEKKG